MASVPVESLARHWRRSTLFLRLFLFLLHRCALAHVLLLSTRPYVTAARVLLLADPEPVEESGSAGSVAPRSTSSILPQPFFALSFVGECVFQRPRQAFLRQRQNAPHSLRLDLDDDAVVAGRELQHGEGEDEAAADRSR